MNTREQILREALEIARRHGMRLHAVADRAVVPTDEDGDGKHDPNPDIGAGREPGEFYVFAYDQKNRELWRFSERSVPEGASPYFIAVVLRMIAGSVTAA